MKQSTSQIAFNILVILVLCAIVSGCKRAPADTSAHAVTRVSPLKCIQTGIASWYGKNMKGQQTASGDKFNPEELTAASRKLPLGTEVNVINLKNNQNVTVTVNDRGPYSGKRIIDMSVAAAHELGMEKAGLADVCVQSMEQAGEQPD